ncbi:cytosolic acyl coenzyme A thioester hydrolase isoform X1 [Panthera uncia]|uniref:cytosolic acyl coenzyme A thioester hydrolase isoform X1 n=1 Tax=Panthera uncia TaxID=29064 RepID=UPI0020FFE996|nr:cytosolic acyl coenzyme A thioester hydrolase isoform X1 [Panthera uncia]
MAPPGLIHSAPGLPDTCFLFQSFADAASMSGPAAETPSAIQICRLSYGWTHTLSAVLVSTTAVPAGLAAVASITCNMFLSSPVSEHPGSFRLLAICEYSSQMQISKLPGHHRGNLNTLPGIMRPDDANVAGNVHGGTILKMIEEAGAIISTRHCNSQNGERCVAALARVERTDFLSPMCIGEVAHVSAEITYTSKHSVEVQVNVMSENILTGTKKLTNKATLWYVPLSLKNVDKVLEVPPVVYSRQEQEEEGRKRYEAQKLERMETKWRNGDIVQPVPNPEPNTVSYSQSSLIHLVGPSDCTLHGFVHGGVTMKLMDEVAGIVAARHCKTNIVTASVDAINFHDKIRKGCVITISGRMTFTSNKSMEIEVLVDADPVVDNSQKRYRAASAFFTYVSLSQEGKSLPVPQLVPETEDEKKRFEEGKGRYLQMKAKRQGQAEPQP